MVPAGSLTWVGHVRLPGWVEAEGSVAGQTLLVSYAEKTHDGQLVISDPHTYCSARMTDRFRLRSGSQVAESFSPGARAAQLAPSGSTGLHLQIAACISTLAPWSTRWASAVAFRSATDDPQLQQIAHLCEENLVACLQDSFVDSAWRESSLWLQGCSATGVDLHAMTGDTRPLRQALTLAVAGAYPDGVLLSAPGRGTRLCHRRL